MEHLGLKLESETNMELDDGFYDVDVDMVDAEEVSLSGSEFIL